MADSAAATQAQSLEAPLSTSSIILNDRAVGTSHYVFSLHAPRHVAVPWDLSSWAAAAGMLGFIRRDHVVRRV